LQVNRGDPEIGVAELALDNDQRNTPVGHLDRMSVPQLVRGEPATRDKSARLLEQ